MCASGSFSQIAALKSNNNARKGKERKQRKKRKEGRMKESK